MLNQDNPNSKGRFIDRRKTRRRSDDNVLEDKIERVLNRIDELERTIRDVNRSVAQNQTSLEIQFQRIAQIQMDLDRAGLSKARPKFNP